MSSISSTNLSSHQQYMSNKLNYERVSCIWKSMSASGMWSKSNGGCTIGLNASCSFFFGAMVVFCRNLWKLTCFEIITEEDKKKWEFGEGERKGINQKWDSRNGICDQFKKNRFSYNCTAVGVSLLCLLHMTQWNWIMPGSRDRKLKFKNGVKWCFYGFGVFLLGWSNLVRSVGAQRREHRW